MVKQHHGMQAHEELTGQELLDAQSLWLAARDDAIENAEHLLRVGAHKQIVNRILEPFSHITVLVTSDSWGNFFALRDHPDAQPEIRELARKMQEAMGASVPVRFNSRDWHMPYIDDIDRKSVYDKLKENRITRDEPRNSDVSEMLCAISAARCARVSYLNHESQRPTLEEDLKLFRRLSGANPPHMSPCEHQAHPCREPREGNFRRWSQFRHTIQGNTVYDC